MYSCCLCDEVLHRAPLFDCLGNLRLEQDEDMHNHVDLTSAYIQLHFLSVQHERNLREATSLEYFVPVSPASWDSSSRSTPDSSPNSSPIIRRSHRSGKRTSSPPICKVCRMTSSLRSSNVSIDGSYTGTLTPDHLKNIQHKRCMEKFLAISQEETRLIAFKKPGCATAVGRSIAGIARRRMLPDVVEELLQLLVGVRKKTVDTKQSATTAGKVAAVAAAACTAK